jgi:hypothetical protein
MNEVHSWPMFDGRRPGARRRGSRGALRQQQRRLHVDGELAVEELEREVVQRSERDVSAAQFTRTSTPSCARSADVDESPGSLERGPGPFR